MKASIIRGPGVIDYVEIHDQDPGAGEVVVRPIRLAICGSDVFHVWYMAAEDYPQPVGTTGHEMVGVVEKVGADVTGLSEGDITLTLSLHHTAMTEQYLTSAEDVLPLPKGRTLNECLMAQQLGTVVYASKKLPNIVGKTAVVIGQGSAGLFWASMLKRLGAVRVYAMDVMDERLSHSRTYGADATLNNAELDPVEAVMEWTNGVGADLVIEAAGEASSINLAAQLVRTQGTMLYFGIPRQRDFQFDFWTRFRSYATVHTIAGSMAEPGRTSFRTALELIERGEIDVSNMVTHTFGFGELESAYELARSREAGALKVVVDMPLAEKYANM